MSKVQLNQKEQHYADSREQAEEIVSAAKENDSLQMHKITERYNKYGQYFLIDLTYAYQTPKEVMESRPPQDDNTPEGQLTIEDTEEDIEFVEDDSEEIEEPLTSPFEDENKDDLPF